MWTGFEMKFAVATASICLWLIGFCGFVAMMRIIIDVSHAKSNVMAPYACWNAFWAQLQLFVRDW